MAKKNFFFHNHTIEIFLFVAAIILSLVTIEVLFIICKHTKLKSLVSSLALQQIRIVDMVTKQEHFSTLDDIAYTCKIQ